MSYDINNYIKRVGNQDRSDINKILEALQEINPSIEQDALKEKIALSPEVREQTTSVITGASATHSPKRTKEQKMFTRYFTSQPTYPLTHTTEGTLSFPGTSTKYGGRAVFDGSQYITIGHNAQIDLTTDVDAGLIFWFKSEISTLGTMGIFSKKDSATDANPGFETYFSGNPNPDYYSDDFDSTQFDQTVEPEKINVKLGDGSSSVTLSKESASMFDGNWHSICVNINKNNPVEDFHADNFDTDDFNNVLDTPSVELFLDKTSIGSTSISLGSLTNSLDAIIGARQRSVVDEDYDTTQFDSSNYNNSLSTNETKLIGSLAYMFYRGKPFSSSEITAFHDNARIGTDNEKTSLHFVFNETPNSNASF